MKYFLVHMVLAVLVTGALRAQAPLTDSATLSITGYADAYYAYYTDTPASTGFQRFPTVSPRSNSAGLNTAQLALHYCTPSVRSSVAIHMGDIASSSWDDHFRNIQEANIGMRVAHNLWIDGGFFRTHFGTEMLNPVENIASSLAVGTFFEPYYESGLRLCYSPSPALELKLYLLNGYNVFIDNNSSKSAGLALTYSLNEEACIGYSNYIGDDSPDNAPTDHLRFCNNAYFNYHHKHLQLQVGGDAFLQSHSDLPTHTHLTEMYSGLATVKYQVSPSFAVYDREEIFDDKDGIVTGVITDDLGHKTGLMLWGVTAGTEYKPTPGSYVRLEGRLLEMERHQELFYYNGHVQNHRYEIMLNAGVSFDVLKHTFAVHEHAARKPHHLHHHRHRHDVHS